MRKDELLLLPYSKFWWKNTHSFKSCDDLELVHFTYKHIDNAYF